MQSPAETVVSQALERIGIPFRQHNHPPVYTVAEAQRTDAGLPGMRARCLFLRNKKGERHYLAILEESRPLDLKRLAQQVGETALGLASPQRLARYLGVEPGAVGPFGLLNDAGRAVSVLLDADLLAAEWIGFHPNVNTATWLISGPDLEKFLVNVGANPCKISF